MNITEHGKILRILEQRAGRYRPGSQGLQQHERMDERLDETGTLRVQEGHEAAVVVGLAARVAEEREL